MLFLLNVFSAIFAFLAAGFWWRASVARVLSDYAEEIPPGTKYLTFHGGKGPISRDHDGKWVDVVGTLERQGKLNAWAAKWAALAALCQAGAIIAGLLLAPSTS